MQLKALHVIQSVSPLLGGPSEVIRTLCPCLIAKGCDVDVISTDDRLADGMPLAYTVDGVTYRRFSKQIRFYSVSWPMTYWLQRNIKQYSVVHVHGLFSYVSTVAGWAAIKHRVPYIVRPFGTLDRWSRKNRRPWLKRASFHVLERRLLMQAAAVQYTSEQERREAEELDVTQNPVIVPNPVDLEAAHATQGGVLRRRYPVLEGKIVLLFLSRLDPKKGLDLLLPAFARISSARPEAMLVIAGSGSPHFEAYLHDLANRLGIESRVLWLGFLTGAEKWAALADADLFVLPSYSENFGIAAAEAMACATPVIVTEGVGIHSFIKKAEAGLVSPADIPALTNSLEQLMCSPELRLRMGANGKKLAHSEYSADSVSSKMLQLYRSVL